MDTAVHWEELYRKAYPRGMDRLAALKGVACAFHSVIDGVIRLTPEIIQPVLNEDPSLKAAALAGCMGEPPPEILTPQDFIKGMFYSIFRGSALQRMIRSEETYLWALEKFGPGMLRLGGTSGNMARSLVPLGIPVTVYANPLTRELADLFGDFNNLFVIHRNNGHFVLDSPKQAAREEGIFAIHWIFEYNSDFAIHVDGLHISPHRANRYIPSWNPRNNQFHMNETFAEGFLSLVHNYDYLFFSGFHILSENYPDGCTCYDVIHPLNEYLKRVLEHAPDMRIHLELASIASPIVRRAVLELIIPHVYSLGLNEAELPLMLELLSERMAYKLIGNSHTSLDYARAIAEFMRHTGVQRVHFHNLGYYLCLKKTKSNTSAENTRDSLLFASVMAAARAKNGLFSSTVDIEAGLSTAIGELGLQQVAHLADSLNQPSIQTEGIGQLDEFLLTVVPTKLVDKPLFTVGLGDTISTGALLTE